MSTPSRLLDLERQVRELPYADQLWFMERLAHHLRAVRPMPSEALLADMAADPEVQRALREIELDFANTEQDGLEDGP